MSVLDTDQIMTLVEVLVILMGIAITWAVYYGSENAELPGDATSLGILRLAKPCNQYEIAMAIQSALGSRRQPRRRSTDKLTKAV